MVSERLYVCCCQPCSEPSWTLHSLAVDVDQTKVCHSNGTQLRSEQFTDFSSVVSSVAETSTPSKP
jgi:hypothetical protein